MEQRLEITKAAAMRAVRRTEKEATKEEILATKPQEVRK